MDRCPRLIPWPPGASVAAACVARQLTPNGPRTSCPSITFSPMERLVTRFTSWYTVEMPAPCASPAARTNSSPRPCPAPRASSSARAAVCLRPSSFVLRPSSFVPCPLSLVPAMIALVDYGAGNLTSVRKAFAHLGAEIFTPAAPGDLHRVAAVVVPGVGEQEVGPASGRSAPVRHHRLEHLGPARRAHPGGVARRLVCRQLEPGRRFEGHLGAAAFVGGGLARRRRRRATARRLRLSR